jgi:thiol-disulfide isomerase/thioredoxin
MPSQFKSIFFFFFLLNQLAAQEVVITVLAPGYSQKKVNIWIQDDLFTSHSSLIDSKIIENDQAVFNFEIQNIKLLRITLDYQYGLMLVEPGADYQVIFPFPEDRSNITLAGTARVQLIFKDLDSNDINFNISEFNLLVDNFIIENITVDSPQSDSLMNIESQPDNSINGTAISRFSEREMIKQVDLFHKTTDSIFFNSDDYFSSYRKYVFANLDFSMGVKRRKLYFKYLENAKVEYNNVEFVKFFKTFYDDFFDFYSYYPYSNKLIAAFESNQPIDPLLKIVKSDTLTGSDEMQWLILQMGLYDLYPNTSRWKGRIIEILELLKKENPYEEQRLIAANMIADKLKGKKGTAAPKIMYINAKDDTLYLSDLEGKMVYIQFFASWNKSALAEMELMMELRKRYGNIVEFLSVSIDENFSDFTSFVANNKDFKWEFGWIGDDAELWNEYEIVHLPLFYLLDEHSNIISWPALWPSTGVESIFQKIKYERKNTKKKSYWNAPPSKSNKDG